MLFDLRMVICFQSILLFGIGAPLEKNDVTITEFVNTNKGTDYAFRYRTSDGVVRKEEGNLVTYPDGSQGMVVAGVYWYTGPDEMLHAVKYEADANGYRAKSSTTKDINDILDFINFEPRIGIHVLISLVGSNG